jgi:uroporphyrinogen decarboxylase
MNSRERIIKTLNHKEPDKIPIELNGSSNSSLTIEAYKKLRKFLGLYEDKYIDVSWITMGTVRAKEDLLEIYGIDTRSIFLQPSQKTKIIFLPDGSFYDDFGARWKPASYYYDVIERPLENINRIKDLEKVTWDDPCDITRIDGLKKYTIELFEETDKCLVGDFHTLGPFEGGCYLRGFENFLMDLYQNEKFAKYLLDKLTEYCIKKWDLFLNEVGDYVQVVCQGDDLGMQNSLYISPEMYRNFIKPLHRKIYDFIKTKTKAKILMHSCGSINKIIKDFIEIGVEVLNPIQRSAAGMDIKTLKNKFGRDISFWGGGIDIQQQLPNYNLKQIDEEIKRTIDILAPGGGFIFFPTHNIQPDVPPENIDQMFKSVMKYGNYT